MGFNSGFKGLNGLGCCDWWRKRSEFVLCRCIPQWVVLFRMCIWYIY